MFDIVSYILGKKAGAGVIELDDSEEYTFTDDGDGNITVEEADNNG